MDPSAGAPHHPLNSGYKLYELPDFTSSQRSQQYQDHVMSNSQEYWSQDNNQSQTLPKDRDRDMASVIPKSEYSSDRITAPRFPLSQLKPTPEIPNSYNPTPQPELATKTSDSQGDSQHREVLRTPITPETDYGRGEAEPVFIPPPSSLPTIPIPSSRSKGTSASQKIALDIRSRSQVENEDLIMIDPDQASQTAKLKWNAKRRSPTVIAEEEAEAARIKREGTPSLMANGSEPPGERSAAEKGKGRAIDTPDPAAASSSRYTQESVATPRSASNPSTQNGGAIPRPSFQNAKLSQQQKMLAAQKAMMSSGNLANKTAQSVAPIFNSSIFGPKKTKVVEPNTQQPKRARRVGIVPDESVLAEMAMAPPEAAEEDLSWMNAEDGDEEYTSLCQLRDALVTKRDERRITLDEKVELIQISDRIEILDKIRNSRSAVGHGHSSGSGNDGDGSDEEGMFVHEKPSVQEMRRNHRKNRPKRGRQTRNGNENDSHSDGEDSNNDFDGDLGAGPDRAELERLRQSRNEDLELARELQKELNCDNNETASTSLEDDGDPGPSSQGKKSSAGNSRKPAAKNAREKIRREEDERREKERKKAQRKKSKKSSGGNEGKKSKSKPVGGRSSGPGKKGKGNAAASGSHDPDVDYRAGRPKNLMQGQNMDFTTRQMLADLLHNDAIADRIAAGYDPQPEIAARNKTSQFEQILASVPKSLGTHQRGREKQEILNASKAFGYAKVKAVDGKWLPKGMKSSLYHHQLLGARWMLERELSQRQPTGGINADAMGLGKTVEMLATMIGNPPTPEDTRRGVKTTLLVLPSAVIEQWMTEIKKHVKEIVFPRVMVYKTSKNIPRITLTDQDIVLTSYNEVMNSYPYPDAAAMQKIGTGGLNKWLKSADELKGDLHKIQWYRVVLDEAHAIKNYKGRTSLACQRLQGVYRWCLTGTPVLNRIEELYPYLRFLRIPMTNSYQEFVQWFCDPDAEDCQARIGALLSFSMLRRHMNTKLLGRAIVSLPEPHPEIHYIDLSKEERIIYRITENRFRASINEFFLRKDDRSTHGNFMVQLLRLRQCTSHPIMLEQTIKECWTAEDLQILKKRLRAIAKDKSTPIFKQCKLWVDEAATIPGTAYNISLNGSVGEASSSAAAEGSSSTAQPATNATPGVSLPFGTGNYGHEFDISKYLSKKFLRTRNIPGSRNFLERVICTMCSDVPKDPQITDCSHIFCKDCLTDYMNQAVSMNDSDTNDLYFECPSCQLIFHETRPFSNTESIFPNDDNPAPTGPNTSNDNNGYDARPSSSQNNGSSSTSASGSGGAKGTKGKDVLGFEPITKPSIWLNQSDHREDMPLLPSAKTTALKAKLLKWFEEAPNDKVVVFTQFRLLSRIVGRIAESEKWPFLYYSGEAVDAHRAKVVEKFHTDPSIKLLIAGLKCGGQGLNLTCANRCISLDLWWNHAVEQQAFGRTFRLGQLKETYFSRICVRNTVEMRMLAMQADKLKIIERMMQDGKDARTQQLDIKELTSLFGFLNEDGAGNMRVEPDYVDEDGDDGEEGSPEGGEA